MGKLSTCQKCKYVHWNFGWKNEITFWECTHVDRKFTYCSTEITSVGMCGPNQIMFEEKEHRKLPQIKVPKFKLPKVKLKWQ